MGRLFQLTTAQQPEWNAIVARSAWHDFYHRADYHQLEERSDDAQGRLMVYEEGDSFIALPLLIRPLPAHFPQSQAMRDATSVFSPTPAPCRS